MHLYAWLYVMQIDIQCLRERGARNWGVFRDLMKAYFRISHLLTSTTPSRSPQPPPDPPSWGRAQVYAHIYKFPVMQYVSLHHIDFA